MRQVPAVRVGDPDVSYTLATVLIPPRTTLQEMR